MRGRTLGSCPKLGGSIPPNSPMLFDKFIFSKSLFHINNLYSSGILFFYEEFLSPSYFVLLILTISYLLLHSLSVSYVSNRVTSSYKPFSLSMSGQNIFNQKYLLSNITITLSYILLIFLSVRGFETSFWYSHITFSSFQLKIIYLILLSYFLTLSLLLRLSLSLSDDKLDFILSTTNLFYWIMFIFMTNNLFTFIFIVEILSISVMLLNTTSIFYENNLNQKSNFSNNYAFFLNLPYFKVNSLLLYFWVSFIASTNLFIFLYLYIYYFLTLDLVLSEVVLSYLKVTWGVFSFLPYLFTWSVFLISIFVKCGLVPFFMWKPNFFKGISFKYLFVYITFYYFFTLIFILNFVFVELVEYVSIFIIGSVILLISGLLIILTQLYSVTYIKSFLAYSSILNSLLVFTLLLFSI